MARPDTSGGNLPASTSALNKPFDGRISTIHGIYDGQRALQRGWLVHHPRMKDTRGFIGRVNFLFNPQELTVSTPVNLSIFYAGSDYTDANSNSSATDNTGIYQNVAGGAIGNTSVNLLFDRTYEVNSGQVTAGVYDDVLALYKFLGLVDTTSGIADSNDIGMVNSNSGDIMWSLDPKYYPSMYTGPTMCYLVMGAIRLYGAISNLDVTYTHWSSQLIPMRCAVSISMDLYNKSSGAWDIDLSNENNQNAFNGGKDTTVTGDASTVTSPLADIQSTIDAARNNIFNGGAYGN